MVSSPSCRPQRPQRREEEVQDTQGDKSGFKLIYFKKASFHGSRTLCFLLLLFGTCTVRNGLAGEGGVVGTVKSSRGGGSANTTNSTQPEEEEEEEGGRERNG